MRRTFQEPAAGFTFNEQVIVVSLYNAATVSLAAPVALVISTVVTVSVPHSVFANLTVILAVGRSYPTIVKSTSLARV